MKTAHDDRYAERPELPAEIERARKLVGLNADQTDHAAAGGANALGDGADIYGGVALVAGLDLDADVGTEHVRLRAILDQRIDAGETVRGNVGAPPLNDIAVIVIMRRLDQRYPESTWPHGKPIPRIKFRARSAFHRELCRQGGIANYFVFISRARVGVSGAVEMFLALRG